jgi:UDP-N-acetylglucosamine 2-epimerase (hydrolysing)
MRFEYFLRVLKDSSFIIGNSSAGIREAPFFGIQTIDIGDRQYSRAKLKSVVNSNFNKKKILNLIKLNKNNKFRKILHFGDGKSSNKIVKILKNKFFWQTPIQKKFKSID